MPTWAQIVLYCVGVLVLLFFASNVLFRYRSAHARLNRVRRFLGTYARFVAGHSDERLWLAAHASEMQRDAQSVDQGVTYIAPPPMLGGGAYQPHPMFADLFNRQSSADNVTAQLRLEVLAAVQHELETLEGLYRLDLFNPLAWIRLLFERLARFPRYLLRTAGFSNRVTDSGFARVITAIWSLAVGAATIGAFIVGLIALGRS